MTRASMPGSQRHPYIADEAARAEAEFVAASAGESMPMDAGSLARIAITGFLAVLACIVLLVLGDHP